jgi:hypothetical protein
MNNSNRHKLYFELNDKLSYLSDDEVKQIIRTKHTDKAKKWGLNKIHIINNHKIFIKAIPVAKLFAQNRFNSSNLYHIPAYYNYGYGSAGINPWRELLLHIKTTNFVLNDVCDFFPVLYHYRIITDSDNSNIISGLDKDLMKRWDNNHYIKKYLKDRSNADLKIVLFLEFIPNVAYEYLSKNPDFVADFFSQSKRIINFCNKNGILHNDSHMGNYIIDENNRVYLTDFGLSLDIEFNLDNAEKKFFKFNQNLDKYYTIMNIFDTYTYPTYHNKLINDKYELKNHSDPEIFLIDNIDQIKNDIQISDFIIRFIKKYRSMMKKYIVWHKGFFTSTNKENYFVYKL